MAKRMKAKEEQKIIKLAILAVGGQGGGVLTNWITDVAERNGYLAQATSVAGVAQRTGATIYYVEMCQDTGRRPVFSLAPAQGDIDIDNGSKVHSTTLIASTTVTIMTI